VRAFQGAIAVMEFDATTLQSIRKDGGEFARLYVEFVSKVFASAELKPQLSSQRLQEAYGAWLNDLDRVEGREQKLVNGMDHFKQAGHLAFWLRRFSPIVGQSSSNGDVLDKKQQDWRDLLFSYANEFTAFMMGYNIVLFYEKFRADTYDNHRPASVSLTNDYLQMACHFMKYKSTSPHAMAMIYKSLFVQCGSC
jgi:hypothetical protein